MEPSVVSPHLAQSSVSVPPRTTYSRPQTYALITIDACVPILAQALTNVTELFERCAAPLSSANDAGGPTTKPKTLSIDAYLDLCTKVGPAANLLLPNPHISHRNRYYTASLLSESYMWENAIAETLHHVKPTLAEGLPYAMEELDQRGIIPVLLTHRNESLFAIVISSLSSSDQMTLKGLFPKENRLASSSVNQGSHISDDMLVYTCLDQTPFGAKGNKSFAVEVSPLGTRCATANGIETIAYDLMSHKGHQATPSSRALTASGACAVIRRWRDLRPMLDNTIYWPIPKPKTSADLTVH